MEWHPEIAGYLQRNCSSSCKGWGYFLSLVWQMGRHLLVSTYPQLFSFVKSQHLPLCTASSTEHFQNLFHLPLSVQAFAQFQTCNTTLQSLQLSSDKDNWSYMFADLKIFHILGHQQIHRSYKCHVIAQQSEATPTTAVLRAWWSRLTTTTAQCIHLPIHLPCRVLTIGLY